MFRLLGIFGALIVAAAYVWPPLGDTDKLIFPAFGLVIILISLIGMWLQRVAQ